MNTATMPGYGPRIRDHRADAEGLELLYQQARRAGDDSVFIHSVEEAYAAEPDNLLYAAWHYRLLQVANAVRRRIRWEVAVPLSLLTGVAFWLLAGEPLRTVYDYVPAILLFGPAAAAVAVLAFLAVVSRRDVRLAGLAGGAVILAALYVPAVARAIDGEVMRNQYLDLAVLHLILLCVAAVGFYLLAGRPDPANRFAFLLKALEIVVVGGLFVITGGIFTAVSFILFEAIGIEISEALVRLFVIGGGGLIPVLAVALVYVPEAPPAGQSFGDGLSGLIGTLLRVLLPLTIGVLAVYLALIPFNFAEPFRNRDTLISYNAMLFAVLALLVGVTPFSAGELGERQRLWLRRGIVTAALLAGIVSLYAFSAIAYRTWQYGFTLNRLAFVGWNVINLGILAWLLWRQRSAGGERWLEELHATFGAGMIAYAAWALVVIGALPWLF